MRHILLLFLLIGSFSLAAQIGCDSALVVTYGITDVADYVYPNDNDTDCEGGSPGDMASWFSFTATEDTLVEITTGYPGSSNADTRLSIFGGECGALFCIDGDDDGGTGTSALIEFTVVAGETYYIVFDNRYSSSEFSFRIQPIFVAPVLIDFSQVEINRSGTLRATVDMNGDYLDDVISISDDAVHLQYQNTDGTFTPDTIETTIADNFPSWSLTAGDLNGDSKNDLIYGGGSGTTFMLTTEDGGFEEVSPEIYIFCQRGNCVDLNNDGLLDLFMCHDVEPNVYFTNQDNTDFVPTQGGIGDTPDGGNYGSIWIDYDNDGDQDLFIAKCRGGDSDANINQMHRNNGDGTFTEVGEELNLADRLQTWSSAWGDFDNDGDMDVFVGASSLGEGDYHRLMRNDGTVFTDVSEGSGVETITSTSIENCTHDFNNDGLIDIFGAGNQMLLNNGDMTFSQSNVEPSSGPVGDMNNDGFLDIVNGFVTGTTVLHMGVPNGNNYLMINTVGTVSNTNGIGARVEVYTANGGQIRDVRSGDGFRFMSSLNTHFGLGTATTIDSVVVNWPSGIVDVIINPDINSILKIVEGEMPSANQEFAPQVVTLFPNPTAEVVNLPVELVVEGAIVDVFDVNGKLLIRQNLNDQSIEVAQLAAGTYQLVYRNAETIRIGKFVKR